MLPSKGALTFYTSESVRSAEVSSCLSPGTSTDAPFAHALDTLQFSQGGAVIVDFAVTLGCRQVYPEDGCKGSSKGQQLQRENRADLRK